MTPPVLNSLPLSEAEVLDAAAALVRAFAATDTAPYFAAFSEDATFIFYPEPRRLNSRAEYEALWQGWLAEGWRIQNCESSNQLVQLAGETAIFSHDVRTTTDAAGTIETTYERETIVFARAGASALKAVHEHLSPVPTPNAEA